MTYRFSGLLLATAFLVSCSTLERINPWEQGPGEEKKLTAEEFRKASETVVSWRAKGTPRKRSDADYLDVKILGINDLHGHLNGLNIAGRPVGGASVLASYLEAAEVPGRTLIVHAGDIAGASPPVSALLQDEPTIGFLNMLANEHCSKEDLADPECNMVGTIGNHEFDDGRPEMLRLIYGGPFKEESGGVRQWEGAKFPYVSANIVVTETGKPLVPPYVIKEIEGEKIAFIGAVLEDVASIVMPSSVEGLTILDEAEAVNSYIPELHAQGVHAIVLIIHQGLRQEHFGRHAIVGEGELSGEIIDVTQRLDDDVDLVVSGHAHAYTNVLVPNNNGKKILLVQAYSYATAYDDIDITIDRESGDIVAKSATIMTTWADAGPGLTPDVQVAKYVDAKNKEVEPLVTRVVGHAAEFLGRTQNDAGESPLAMLIADANRASTGADFAFVMMGGVRASLDKGPVEWGQVSTLLPFRNQLVTMSLTGEQLERLMRQQWHPEGRDHVLQVSGMVFTWDAAKPWDQRFVDFKMANGDPIDPQKSYRVTVTNFHANGGDGFTVLKEGADWEMGAMDIDALIDYFKAQGGPVSPPPPGRITRLN
ncbi:MAG: bifunctional metallophosphatase/5'-nucleotidase [Alphaproteobacteria bacterium]|nr:MAG: bifunctional metallophosphatase/5'-nucleotidase [Alphaproteobacteria bacterium]